jgi:hypothetical protein
MWFCLTDTVDECNGDLEIIEVHLLLYEWIVVLRIIWRKYLNDKRRKVAPQRRGSHWLCKSLGFTFSLE